MITTVADLADLLGLESTDQPTPPTFQDLLQRLYAGRFQGTVILYFAHGIPRRVEFPQPVQIALDAGPLRRPPT